MIRVRLQIGEDGLIKDTYDAYGLIFLSSDNIFAPPTKGFAKSSYPEQAGENVDSRTVDDAFDYKVKFCIEAPNKNLRNANAKIKQFNDLMFTQSTGSDVKTFKEFIFYNDRKRAKIVGTPEPISEVGEDDFFRDDYKNVYDAVVVELKLRVTNPAKCDFDMDAVYEEYSPSELVANTWYGLYSENSRIYKATSTTNRSIVTQVRKGSVVYVRTSGGGSAIPWMTGQKQSGLTTFKTLEYYDRYDGSNEFVYDVNYMFTPNFDGLLFVNCVKEALDNFALIVDNRTKREYDSSYLNLIPNYYGLYNENTRAYVGTNTYYVAGFQTTVKKGSKITITTNATSAASDEGSATSLIIAEPMKSGFNSYKVLYFEENKILKNKTITSEYDGVLLVSCGRNYVNDFSLVIDDSEIAATASTLELKEGIAILTPSFPAKPENTDEDD